jgi:arginine-tRNA-protein transferase
MTSSTCYFPNGWPLLIERMERPAVDPGELDAFLAEGWRFFGSEFFRASVVEEGLQLKRQVALRIDLARFAPTRSQRRVWKRNRDLGVEVASACPGAEEQALFLLHRERFRRNIPERLEDFLGRKPDGVPTACLQISVRREGRLVAASFLSLGADSCSSIYGIFDPAESRRSLGIHTMLLEIEHARSLGKSFYYSGYATMEPGCYDYKKGFTALSYFAWQGRWESGDEVFS